MIDKQELIANFFQELRRGTIILCVLANLKESTYGYGLIEKLKEAGVSVEANTLYPLLRRLESQNLLVSSWDTKGRKPRKYYILTDFGKEVLDELKQHWETTVYIMDDILKG